MNLFYYLSIVIISCSACIDFFNGIEDEPSAQANAETNPSGTKTKDKEINCAEIFANNSIPSDLAKKSAWPKLQDLLKCIAQKPLYNNRRETFKIIKNRIDIDQKEVVNSLVKYAIEAKKIEDIIMLEDYIAKILEESIFGENKNERFDIASHKEILNKYKNKDIKNNPELREDFLYDMEANFSSLGKIIAPVASKSHFTEYADRKLFEQKIDPSIKRQVAELFGENSPEYIRALGLTDGVDICKNIIDLFLNANTLSFAEYQKRMKHLGVKFQALPELGRLSLFAVLNDELQYWQFGYDSLQRLLFLPPEPESAVIIRESLSALQKLFKNIANGESTLMYLGGAPSRNKGGIFANAIWNLSIASMPISSAEQWINKAIYDSNLNPLQLAIGRVGAKKLAVHVNPNIDAIKSIVDSLLFFGANPFVKVDNNKTMFSQDYGASQRVIDVVVKNLAHDQAKLDKLYDELNKFNNTNLGIGIKTLGGKNLWIKGALEGYSIIALQKAYKI